MSSYHYLHVAVLDAKIFNILNGLKIWKSFYCFKVIEEKSFGGLVNLATLALNENLIHTVQNGAFRDLTGQDSSQNVPHTNNEDPKSRIWQISQS